jgi:hypothetical protein
LLLLLLVVVVFSYVYKKNSRASGLSPKTALTQAVAKMAFSTMLYTWIPEEQRFTFFTETSHDVYETTWAQFFDDGDVRFSDDWKLVDLKYCGETALISHTLNTRIGPGCYKLYYVYKNHMDKYSEQQREALADMVARDAVQGIGEP